MCVLVNCSDEFCFVVYIYILGKEGSYFEGFKYLEIVLLVRGIFFRWYLKTFC